MRCLSGHRRRAGDGGDPRSDDVLKVIDQGLTTPTNAISIRKFFEKTRAWRRRQARLCDSHSTGTAFPKRRCMAGQVLVYQVPIPEPLRS